MEPSVGMITIGQTPRVDMHPAIQQFLPATAKIIEKGVLDELSKEQILELAPSSDQTTLVSRLRDGDHARLAKEKIIPKIQQLIDELNDQGVSVIILACTGKFPVFQSQAPVIYPDYLLNHVVKGVFRHGTLGVIVPLQEQAQDIVLKWGDVELKAEVEASSPYDFQESALIQAAKRLNQLPIKAVLLDCMGYTEEMKEIVKTHTSKPVILSRNVIFRTTAELL